MSTHGEIEMAIDKGQPARGASTTDPTDGLAHERSGAAGRAGVPAPHPRMQHLAGCLLRGQQRVVAPHPGVTEPRALLRGPEHPTDRGVEVDGQIRIQIGTEPSLPGSSEDLPGDLVEHPHARPDEPPQPGPHRGGRPALIEQLTASPRTQHINVSDRVAPGQHRPDHRHGLGATVGPPDRLDRQLQMLIDQLRDPELLRQRRRCQQPRVGDQIALVEGRSDRGERVR